MAAGVVAADHLSKWYGQVIGLNDVSVTVPQGQHHGARGAHLAQPGALPSYRVLS
jgi:hypothetical protein